MPCCDFHSTLPICTSNLPTFWLIKLQPTEWIKKNFRGLEIVFVRGERHIFVLYNMILISLHCSGRGRVWIPSQGPSHIRALTPTYNKYINTHKKLLQSNILFNDLGFPGKTFLTDIFLYAMTIISFPTWLISWW